jgi:hypothetical protein
VGHYLVILKNEKLLVSKNLPYCEILYFLCSIYRDTSSPVSGTTTTLGMLNPEEEGTAMFRNVCNIPDNSNIQGTYV